MSSPTVISTFAGPGGSSIGYERAGFDVRAALDCAPGKFSNAIVPTYKKNHPDTEHVTQDARETSADELLDAAGLSRGEVDVIDGSPPCSPFSGANNKVDWGDHESGTLFDRYKYYIEEIQPRAFVAENVPKLAQGKTKGYYKRLCENLREAGYNLHVQNIDAAYLGAAHHRRRLMFIGVRQDIGTPPKIEPISKPTSIREAWNDLERDPKKAKQAKKRLERSIKYDEFSRCPPGNSIDVVSSQSRFNDDYRLSFRECAPTPTAQANFAHPSEDRYITLNEFRAIMGLPVSYEYPDKVSAGQECLVRCLPPCLLETIANELQETVL